MSDYSFLKIEGADLWVLMDESQPCKDGIIAVLTRDDMEGLAKLIKEEGFK